MNSFKEPGKRTININLDKLVTCTTFFSHIISKEGIKLNQKKVEGITQMQTLEDEKQLSSFLGLVYYHNKFSPLLTELSKLLSDLLFKSIWSSQQ